MTLLLGLACATTGSPPPAATTGPHVSVTTGLKDAGAATQGLSEPERLFAVLEGSMPRAQSCYEEALSRDPLQYGEIVVWVKLDSAGAVRELVSELITITDDSMIACVEGVVAGLSFPTPTREGVSLRYPYIFSSDLTPPEITRAMLVRHGLIDLDEEAEAAAAAARSRRQDQSNGGEGWVVTW